MEGPWNLEPLLTGVFNLFQKLDDYDVEASRVMEVSKQVTKYKLSQVTKDTSELSEDEEFMEILKSYEGNHSVVLNKVIWSR